MQAADQVAELGQGGLGLLVGLRNGLVRFLDGLGLGPGHAQVHGQGDQPLLGAVVQVPLQSAPLGVGGVDHAGPGLSQALHPVFQLLGPARAQQRLGGADVQRREPRGEPGRGHQQRQAADGQVHVHRDVAHRRQVPGRPFRLAAGEQGLPGERPRVGVHQRVQQARQPHREGGGSGHGERRRGQEVIADLAPGNGRADRFPDPRNVQPVRHEWLWLYHHAGRGPQPVPVDPGEQRHGEERGHQDQQRQHPPGPDSQGGHHQQQRHDRQDRDCPRQVQDLAPGPRRPRRPVAAPDRRVAMRGEGGHKATLRGRARTAYPAGFTIRGGATCTLDSVLWANVRAPPAVPG